MVFRKTRKDKKKLYKKKNTIKRKIGGNKADDIYTLLDNTIIQDYLTNEPEETKKMEKEIILEGINNILNEHKDKIIPVETSQKVSEVSKGLFSKMNSGVDNTIELLGSWFIPVGNSEKKKNKREISVLFYPSLIKSKKDPENPDKPKLKFGHIMIKYKNKYADISNYFKTMFRETDDALATIRRGYTHNVKPKYIHKEKIISTELLEDE